jgi:hypothetical protein
MSTNNAECFKNSFTTLKAYIHLFRGHTQCFECYNVERYTEFYVGQLWFNATSNSNAGGFKNNFIVVFHMLVWRINYPSFNTLNHR